MKPNSFKLLIKCVEDGIDAGIQQESEHDFIDMQRLKETIKDEIAREVSEWFTSDGGDL